jgi:hypothetical protein
LVFVNWLLPGREAEKKKMDARNAKDIKAHEQKAKQAAAIAGVLNYLKTESEEQHLQNRTKLPVRPFSAWTQHGRQTIMHMRGLVQRRVLKRQ